MHVCHVMSADLWAGAEVQVATVAAYLVEQPDVRMTAVLFNDGPLAERLRRLGVAVTVIDEHRHHPAAMLVKLAQALRRDRPDIVHTHRYKDTLLGAVAARLAGVPRVFRTVHGSSEALSGWSAIKLGAYESLDRAVMRRLVDRVIAVSEQVALHVGRTVKGPAVVALRNGLVVREVRAARGRDEVRRELGIAPAVPCIGAVGRVAPVKGHRYLLQAAPAILERHPHARFLVVGDGPLLDELQRTAASLDIAQACLFVGARRDVYDLVSAMDVFVLPSRDEGIPMALLEAMALAVPTVATAVGGVPEVVSHRRTGLLVPPRDDRALAAACLELLADRDFARSLAVCGRRAVERNFSHESHGRALVGLYRNATDACALTAA